MELHPLGNSILAWTRKYSSSVKCMKRTVDVSLSTTVAPTPNRSLRALSVKGGSQDQILYDSSGQKGHAEVP